MNRKQNSPAAPGRRKKPPAFQAVLFDIDNVLIDTRFSYLDAVRWTVELYLTSGSIPFFTPPPRSHGPQLLSKEDVDQFKLLGGFNDDWDCCYGMLVYLLNLKVPSRSLKDLKKIMNFKGLAQKMTKRPLGVRGIVGMLGRTEGVMIEKISKIFQEVYLGKDLYERTPLNKAAVWKKRGLIHKEKLIFRKSTLQKLKSMGMKLGIATGRPRFEALFALKRFGALDFFDAMTTIDEVKKAEREKKQPLRKPHPFSLLETAKKLGVSDRLLYIGDLPDDILAAREARKAGLGISSAAFPWYSSHPQALKEIEKARPDFVLRKPGHLPPLVLRGKA